MKKIIIALLCALAFTAKADTNKLSVSVSADYETKNLNYGRTIATDALATGVKVGYKINNPVSENLTAYAGITSFNNIHSYGNYTLAPSVGLTGKAYTLPVTVDLNVTYFDKNGRGGDNFFYSGKLSLTDSKVITPYVKFVWANDEAGADRYGGLVGVEKSFAWKSFNFRTYAEGGALNQYDIITSGGEITWSACKWADVFAGVGYNWNSNASPSVDTYTGAFGNGGIRVKF